MITQKSHLDQTSALANKTFIRLRFMNLLIVYTYINENNYNALFYEQQLNFTLGKQVF